MTASEDAQGEPKVRLRKKRTVGIGHWGCHIRIVFARGWCTPRHKEEIHSCLKGHEKCHTGCGGIFVGADVATGQVT